jgi:hypothetical protein
LLAPALVRPKRAPRAPASPPSGGARAGAPRGGHECAGGGPHTPLSALQPPLGAPQRGRLRGRGGWATRKRARSAPPTGGADSSGGAIKRHGASPPFLAPRQRQGGDEDLRGHHRGGGPSRWPRSPRGSPQGSGRGGRQQAREGPPEAAQAGGPSRPPGCNASSGGGRLAFGEARVDARGAGTGAPSAPPRGREQE